MKGILFALGSRGDIEPLFSLGESLKKKNWEIIYAFPEQFRQMIEMEDSKFYGFTKEFIEVLLASEHSKIITSRKGTGIARIKTLISLASKSIKINKEVTIQQKEIIEKERPDYVFFNQKCVYPIAWGLQNQNRSIFVHPFPCFLHPVDNHSVIGFSGGGNYGKFVNRISYLIQNSILSLAVYFTVRKTINKDSSIKINPFKIRNFLLNEVISIYTVSPTLFKQPKYWGSNANVIGFVERDKSKNWKPTKRLLQFLISNEQNRIFFTTFGSISNSDPETKTKAILKVLKKHRVPTIINTSWGGLIKIEDCPEHILFVNDIPYEWILPKIYGVIHHGGAGTTHSAIKYGCASLIIPHFIDQFFWSRTIVNNELGPKGISIKQLNEQNFEKSLLDLLNNAVYKTNAEKYSSNIQNEFSVSKLIDKIKNTNENKG
ncbi:glycosyltransferase [Muriicola sp. Z0-33]|uniref:glycosyltransferase n=1 Tax=Muriicola sp. Z0-33 TaxID=2816957 RepID=UPI002237F15F|nr:glycosyltransferase [Muriicola sp. Z0-33]MCW5516943.1 glycosyltransferase family 1 protein [Muriicola sp. Z0-33]